MPPAEVVSGKIPKKLRDDAILEAVCQVRFASPELPEVIVGRLSDLVDKAEYVATRLPIADIPAPIRQATPAFRHQATLELRNKDGARIIRIGEDVLSVHVAGVRRYPGWSVFQGFLRSSFTGLFEKLQNVECKAISFRYINAVTRDRHALSDVHQLNLEIKVNSIALTGPVNLNFVVEQGKEHLVTTRIAHQQFVQGDLPEGTSAIIDVEVSTGPEYRASSVDDLMNWVEDAHSHEKTAFFSLIPNKVLSTLVEE